MSDADLAELFGLDATKLHRCWRTARATGDFPLIDTAGAWLVGLARRMCLRYGYGDLRVRQPIVVQPVVARVPTALERHAQGQSEQARLQRYRELVRIAATWPSDQEMPPEWQRILADEGLQRADKAAVSKEAPVIPPKESRRAGTKAVAEQQ
jgi:hypothetical protein